MEGGGLSLHFLIPEGPGWAIEVIWGLLLAGRLDECLFRSTPPAISRFPPPKLHIFPLFYFFYISSSLLNGSSTTWQTFRCNSVYCFLDSSLKK